MAWISRSSQVPALGWIFGQMIELIVPTGFEMPDELPVGCSDHAHAGDLVVVHVVLSEQGVVPSRGL